MSQQQNLHSVISTLFSFSFSALEAAAALGGEGLIPFYGLLEGGREGELFAELEDYFYYAQIRRSVCLRLFTDLSWKTFFIVMFSFVMLKSYLCFILYKYLALIWLICHSVRLFAN